MRLVDWKSCGRSLGLPLAVLLAATLVGCADAADTPTAEPAGLGLWFAALADGTCAATANGTKQVPAGVETLVAHWTAYVQEAGVLVKKTGTAKSSRAQAAEGRWEIKSIPVTQQLEVSIFGCQADKKLAYVGHTDKVAIADGKKQTAHVFLSPVDGLGCVGSPTGAAKLLAPRAMTGSAVLPNGDVVIAGGLGTWDSSQAKGVAGTGVDYYDQRQGHFRQGWNAHLGVGRILPHVLPLGADNAHVLVVGGVLNAKRIGDAKLAMPLLGPELLKESLPATKAELLLVGDQPSTTASKVDPGVGTAVLSSAVSTGKSILFVGGQQQGGQVMDVATRLRNLEDVAAGGSGTTEGNIKLNVPRLRPALLTFPGEETVLVWGGMVPAAGAPDNSKMGELVLDNNQAQSLKITGSAGLLTDASLNAIAPSVAYVQRATGVVTFLVTGGVHADTLGGAKTLTYLVKVDKTAGTAELHPVKLPDASALRTGLFGVATPLDGRRVLLGGGLMSVTEKVAGVCDAAAAGEDCQVSSAWIIRVPTDLGAGDTPAALELLGTQTLSVAKFGMTAAPLPLGVLLAGGQKSTTKGTDAETLSDAAAVLTVSPADEDALTVCQ